MLNKLNQEQSGQILVMSLIILTLLIINTVVIIGGSLSYNQSSKYSLQDVQAVNIAEAGLDKAIASLNKTAGNYNGESETSLGSGSYSVTISTIDASTKQIVSTGYIPNKTNPKVKRSVQVRISKGAGISFVYGMLIGNGGMTMGNGATINGSIYSNGSIIGGNNETITGDIYVAGGTQPQSNQNNDCVSPNCTDFTFGKVVSGSSQLDVAQSFQPSISGVLNKISLKLKKTGNPANITVRIMGDSSGKPNNSSILASGTLSSNLVTSQYGYVDVTFNTAPTLTANTPYWILLDTSSDNSNYWNWSTDLSQSYTRGAGRWSPDWQAKNPSWNNISGDLNFQAWMGGVATAVQMGNGSIIQGNTHANTIQNVTINKDAYYQTIQNSTVRGTSYPNSTDPTPIAMPISANNISDWQAGAAAYGIYNGNISGCPVTIGPGKYVGNFTTNSNCTILVKTPVWITGNLVINNSVIFRMDQSMGPYSGQIIVDGQTTFSNSDDLQGTGQAGSFLTLLSTYNSSATGLDAISTGNSSITGILYAPFGTITLANNANFKEVVADKIQMGTGTILTYDSGLISTYFSTGPSGSFTVNKGTYFAK